MATCKDCIHYDVCEFHLDEKTTMTVNECMHFKDKSKFVELPCKVGTKVYTIEKGRNDTEYIKINGHTYQRMVPQYYITEHEYSLTDFALGIKIGVQLFLTKEEAYQALKEREQECLRLN